jgi:hypothetical protein
MTPKRRAELVDILEGMKGARDVFYHVSMRIGFHQFLEISGFMAEMIQTCQRALNEGRDFQTEGFELASFEKAYIAEKLGCIFGEGVFTVAK